MPYIFFSEDFEKVGAQRELKTDVYRGNPDQ